MQKQFKTWIWASLIPALLGGCAGQQDHTVTAAGSREVDARTLPGSLLATSGASSMDDEERPAASAPFLNTPSPVSSGLNKAETAAPPKAAAAPQETPLRVPPLLARPKKVAPARHQPAERPDETPAGQSTSAGQRRAPAAGDSTAPVDPAAPATPPLSAPVGSEPSSPGTSNAGSGEAQPAAQADAKPLPPQLQRQPEQIPIELQAPAKYQHPVREAKELTLMLGEDKAGYYLYAEGPVQAGAYDKFRKYVDFYQQQQVTLKRFMMHSNGGLLNEGLQIGEYLHTHGWTTDLDQHMRCYSTCAFIYMGGVKKRFQHGALLGFHRPYLPDVPDSEEIISGVYRTYMYRIFSGNQLK